MFRHCVKLLFVPFYFVRFPDFFLGDQFTSHSQTLVDLLHVLVSLFTGSFLYFRDPFASYSPTTLSVIQISLSILPQFIRLAQNLRRYHDSKELYPSIYNGIKYLLSIIANSLVLFKLPYFCAQFIYTIYALCWDLHEDWGLLRIRQDKTLLRAKCLIPYPVAYYLAIVNNTILRFAWILKLFIVIMNSENQNKMLLVFGCIEVIRRNIWNVFRMENEQVNNCGKFR
ncbi:uncharacterized protein [Blastocystis hominis]|uniref:EXS domain-containing protein n=1 Tax=Blastocystis hominis TaxID=12968 RepID=D8M7V2_BLAHO|nr:uncharacterized protein [Blastocystis hominis]CBK24141.2 unnamed protein product [Blastocystis hominis]|eukprot:XP_012898189.1 uncharacterized protein [Blastocystis hominis]